MDNNKVGKFIANLRQQKNLTQKELSNKYDTTERTIRRYIKKLKDDKIITMEDYAKDKVWKLL